MRTLFSGNKENTVAELYCRDRLIILCREYTATAYDKQDSSK